MNARDLERLILYGAVAVGAYLVYRAVSGVASGASKALTTAQQSVSDTLTSIFDPNAGAAAAASAPDYIAVFPDGTKHAISSTIVDPAGLFTYRGQQWQLIRGIAGNAAIPAASLLSVPDSGDQSGMPGASWG